MLPLQDRAPHSPTCRCYPHIERQQRALRMAWHAGTAAPPWCPRPAVRGTLNDCHNGADKATLFDSELLTALPADAIRMLSGNVTHAGTTAPPWSPHWAPGIPNDRHNDAGWSHPLASKPLATKPKNADLTLSSK